MLEKNPELRHDQEATRRACEQFKRRPTTVLNFMEGTRAHSCEARQNSKFRNLLTPKTGGFGYVVGALGSYIDQILDVTIVYQTAYRPSGNFYRANRARYTSKLPPGGTPRCSRNTMARSECS
jgi:1-acyl-sn-glycerol-3-phosphate acyltransferase